MSHIKPWVGGSRKRLIWHQQHVEKLTYRAQVIQCVQLRAETAVDAQELLVHHSCEGKVAEGIHAGIVDRFRILVLA